MKQPEEYTGRVAMQMSRCNALAFTTTLTEGTNVQTTWWVREGGIYKYTGKRDVWHSTSPPEHGGSVYAQAEARATSSVINSPS